MISFKLLKIKSCVFNNHDNDQLLKESTSMKVFEKNSNIFRLLSEAIAEGIMVVNDKQLIVAANGPASEMFGYAGDELIGQNLNSLLPR